jgi:hypothetical protein
VSPCQDIRRNLQAEGIGISYHLHVLAALDGGESIRLTAASKIADCKTGGS